MDRQKIQALMGSYEYSNDVRQAPHAARQREFRRGWREGAEGRSYAPTTLERLTWRNLGFRLGRSLGSVHVDQVDATFDWLADEFARTSRVD